MNKSNLQVIGVGGTNGSGKDTVMQLLAEKYHYLFMSATDMLASELQRRGLPTDRKHKAELSAEWRRESGMGVIVHKAYETYQAHSKQYAGVIVGSLRHPGEADAIHELGGTLIWVDADPKLRYARIQTANRNRHNEDNKSFEEFLAEEEREMHPIGDAATLDMSAVKEKSDMTIRNEGSDIAQFQQEIEAALQL